jgi:hypothetical protein
MQEIPALKRLRQESCELKANLGYIVRPCLKKAKQTKEREKEMYTCVKTSYGTLEIRTIFMFWWLGLNN